MNRQIQPCQLPYQFQTQPYQSLEVAPQFFQEVAAFLAAALFAVWVVQQGIKVFRGEEIERPF